MISLCKLRSSNAAHLGQVLTLEIACAIELSANDRDDHAISPGQFTAVAYKGVVLQDESFREILNELHEAHYRKTELHRSGIPLNMNYPALCESDRIGALIQFTARDSTTGELVGNCRMYLHRSLHTQTNAVRRRGHDFILEACRSSWLGVKFLRYVEDALYQLGVREIRIDTKIVNRVNQLLKRCRFPHVSNVTTRPSTFVALLKISELKIMPGNAGLFY